MPDLHDILKTPAIVAALRQAWHDSHPGVAGGHEEGGFIVQTTAGELAVLRWPRGVGASIVVPPHTGCQIEGREIVATFHTHPNTGADYLQEPSETDKRALRDDADLKGPLYQGELVMARSTVYLVTTRGTVLELGEAQKLLPPI
jgi:hypothetical protein